MEAENIKLSGLLRDKYALILLVAVFIFSTIVSVLVSLLVGALLITSLCTGLLLPYVIFGDGKQIPNLLALFTGSDSHIVQGEMPRSCSVCGGERCQRQHPSTAVPLSIHAHVTCTVPQSVDEALEELLTMVLDHYVFTWYREISIHDQLVDEIRYIIRYAVAALATKLSKWYPYWGPYHHPSASLVKAITPPPEPGYHSDIFTSSFSSSFLTSVHTFHGRLTEDFNRHILDPDLTTEQLEHLHHDALELYHTYMVASALDHIKFPTHIVAHIRESKNHSQYFLVSVHPPQEKWTLLVGFTDEVRCPVMSFAAKLCNIMSPASLIDSHQLISVRCWRLWILWN
ncbi:Sorting nexin-14 [Portunus trituberculatus]|uniref:Sorting nexin-14 n=1 Tax=Portunus trituberculatus TaxID=210409 RepID=A0A5B7E9S2_PORTR|nr:Sorting nexin-14 [Portunus trituberculatus]